MLRELFDAGYVANDKASGWAATAAGCQVIESMRVSSLLHGRDD
jgi:hypothetical protein